MNDELLIALVRQYPVLYDLSNAKYMDTAHKVKIWEHIGKELQSHDALCKARWNNIRDCYRKSLRRLETKSAQEAKRIKRYRYWDHLNFLNKFFDERDGGRETKGNFEYIECEQDNFTIDGEYVTLNDAENCTEYSQSQLMENECSRSSNDASTAPQKLRKRKNLIQENSSLMIKRSCSTDESTITHKSQKQNIPEDSVSSTLMQYVLNKQTNLDASVPTNAIDAFLCGIAPTLKTLNPYLLNLAKSEIFAIVQKYEMKAIMQVQASAETFEESNSSQQIKPNDSTSKYSATPSNFTQLLSVPEPVEEQKPDLLSYPAVCP